MPDTESKSAAHFATLPFRANQQPPDERLLDPWCPLRTFIGRKRRTPQIDDYERRRLSRRRLSGIKLSCLRPPIFRLFACSITASLRLTPGMIQKSHWSSLCALHLTAILHALLQ